MNQFATVSYLAPPAIASGIAAILLITVWRFGHRSHTTNRIFSLLILSIGIWGIVIFGMRASPDAEHALIWDRFVPPIAIAMSVFYYHFSLLITGVKPPKNLIVIFYLLVAVLIALSPTSLFIRAMNVRSFGYSPAFTPGMALVFLLGFILILLALLNLAKGHRGAVSYAEKNRFLFLMIAMAFPLLGGVMDVFIGFFPASMYSAIIFCLLTSVAIYRYHLLDIRVILRKSLAYLLTSTLIAIPYVAVLILLSNTLRAEAQSWWVQPVMVILFAVILQPLHSLAQRIVDRAFYRERYDSLKTLIRFSQKSHSVTDFEELGATMVELVSRALRASNVCLLLRSEARRDFGVKYWSGFQNSPSGVEFSESSALIRWLERSRDILSFKQISTIPQLQGLSSMEKHYIELLGAELFVPIATRNAHLDGVLILGPKLSEQFYSPEDKELLLAVSSQIGMAVDNALLYEEAKESEKALRDSEEFSSSLLLNSPNPTLVLDPDASIRYSNPALAQLTGFTAAQLIGKKPPYPWWPEEGQQDYLNTLQEAFSRGIYRQEILFYNHKREPFWVEVSARPIVKEGETRYYLASWVDITRRKQAEEALRLSEKSLKEAQAIGKIGNWALDLTSTRIEWSDEVYRIYERDKAKGPPSPEEEAAYYPPEEVKKLREFTRRAIAKGEEFDYDLTARLPSERTVFLHAFMRPVKDASGRVIKLFGTVQDITELKQAEELFRSIAMNSPVGVYIAQKRKFVYTNPQFQKDTGYSQDELSGMESLSLVVPEDKDTVRENAIQMLKGNRVATYEFRIINKNKETRWALESVAPIQYRGEQATIATYQDITERKQMQERLIVQERLASIGELASGIAHELNNPLTGVIGLSDLLLARELPADIKEDLQIINKEAHRTANVVKNLLTFARRHPQEKKPVDINSVISMVIELRAYEQKVQNIQVITRFTPGLSQVNANAFQLMQVFINIIINAEYSMIEAHGKGTLIIATEQAGDFIRTTFADDGPGIAVENTKKLFDPFFTTKEVGKGTGLGLSICHGVITEHGGRIWAASELGRGATFIVELPVSPDAAEP